MLLKRDQKVWELGIRRCMRIFLTDEKKIKVLSRRLHQTGLLSLSTRIEIYGNHLKSKVPVKILYITRFTPDEEFWEIDDEYPDEEPMSVTYRNEFASESERHYYCGVWFEDRTLDTT